MPSQVLSAPLVTDDGGRTCPTPNLVLYDGQCPLCHRAVRLLLRADRRCRLCFAPLQGETAGRVREYHGFADDLSTLVYVRDFGFPSERIFFKSTAVLAALGDLGGVWALAAVLRLVPRPVRDAAYDWVARHRTRWFGRYDSCLLPGPPERGRFLP
jgi:predicted DCC family thiol-disulfide oxidoreductase YuxK